MPELQQTVATLETLLAHVQKDMVEAARRIEQVETLEAKVFLLEAKVATLEAQEKLHVLELEQVRAAAWAGSSAQST